MSGEHSFPFLLAHPSHGRILPTSCRALERTVSYAIHTGTSALFLDLLLAHVRVVA
jgi:hypothetical protein